MENVLVNFQSGLDQIDEATKAGYKDDEDEIPDVFSKMLPNKGKIVSRIGLQ
jgi:hypothetical protein